MMKRYNIQKGLPPLAKLPSGKHVLILTRHALEKAESETERFNLKEKIVVPRTIDFDKVEIFEMEAEKGVVLKVVCRFAYNDEYDIVMPIQLNPEGKVVKTLWLNSQSDDHPTLRMDEFADPSCFELDIE